MFAPSITPRYSWRTFQVPALTMTTAERLFASQQQERAERLAAVRLELARAASRPAKESAV